MPKFPKVIRRQKFHAPKRLAMHALPQNHHTPLHIYVRLNRLLPSQKFSTTGDIDPLPIEKEFITPLIPPKTNPNHTPPYTGSHPTAPLSHPDTLSSPSPAPLQWHRPCPLLPQHFQPHRPAPLRPD